MYQLSCPERSLRDEIHRLEAAYLFLLLLSLKGNMTSAAKVSRVGRPYLYKKLKYYGINPEMFRNGGRPPLPQIIADFQAQSENLPPYVPIVPQPDPVDFLLQNGFDAQMVQRLATGHVLLVARRTQKNGPPIDTIAQDLCQQSG